MAIDVSSSPEMKKTQIHHHHQQVSDDESLLEEETESVTTMTTNTVCEDGNGNGNGNAISAVELSRSPEEVSNSETLEKASASEGNFSVDDGGRNAVGRSDSSGVKEYVMEWIGKEVGKERPNSDWIAEGKGRSPINKKSKKKQQQRQLEWWATLDDEKAERKKEKCRPAKVWWREEFCEELAKKKKKKRNAETSEAGELWWQRDEEVSIPVKKIKKKKRSHSSIDWWMDGLSGEFRFGRRCSVDGMSGEIPKSGGCGLSSTPSMRGTVCYIAPECGGGGPPSEKCDVYSYGVLLLVIIAGRRPLQVTGSPMSEFERANLVSWARHLARRGKLLDLVDPAIEELDRDQALLCITVALLCLQRSPLQRPSIKQVVGMLSGQSEAPHLPVEFSPSPPSAWKYKPRKKAR